MPVLRPDAKYAGDYKPEDGPVLAEIKMEEAEIGDNMAIASGYVHVLPVLEKQKSEGQLWMESHANKE